MSFCMPSVRPMGAAWCAVCKCTLPVNRDGRVTKAVQKRHDEGAMHKAELNSLDYMQMGEWRPTQRQLRQHEREYTQPRRAARLAIALGVLATRLRARHGSMEGARESWAEAAEETLRVLQPAALRSELEGPAARALAQHAMRALVAGENHELLRLLFAELGLLE